MEIKGRIQNQGTDSITISNSSISYFYLSKEKIHSKIINQVKIKIFIQIQCDYVVQINLSS